MSNDRGIGVALLGLGVVGSGVARVLLGSGALLESRAGAPIHVKGILVRNTQKARGVQVPTNLLTTDPEGLLNDPGVGVVIELLGGEEPARTYIHQALQAGKHVVTANKEVMAKHGAELMELAAKGGVELLFEASTGGGIPIIGPLRKDLQANDISSVRAIINGTTNYVLTQMAGLGLDFATALEQAQQLGYAETDPSSDIEGRDAAFKLAVLASLSFHTKVSASDVPYEGIGDLSDRDFRYAHELGYSIKLLAIGRKADGQVQVRVHPALLPQEAPLAKIEGAYNAVEVEGDLVGRVLFHGAGAGAEPTSSAVVGDLLAVVRDMTSGREAHRQPPSLDQALRLKPLAELEAQYYMRMNLTDQPGVLSKIASVLGEYDISIASFLQKDKDFVVGTAEVVIITHPSKESAVQKALGLIRGLDVVAVVNNLIRIEPA